MTLRVLLVEDEGLVAMMLEDMLADLGHQSALASNLDQAKALSSAEKFDLAVLDINIGGVRSDGLAQELLASGVPVIFATGYDDAGSGKPQGATILQKPFDRAALQRAISETMNL